MYIYKKINVFDSFFAVGLCTIHFKNEIKVNSHQVLLSFKIAEMEYKYFCYVF